MSYRAAATTRREEGRRELELPGRTSKPTKLTEPKLHVKTGGFYGYFIMLITLNSRFSKLFLHPKLFFTKLSEFYYIKQMVVPKLFIKSRFFTKLIVSKSKVDCI